MKVAHFSIFGPNRCGLYHTAKELVLAECSVGIDAGFIAYEEKKICKDGDFSTKPILWAEDADIFVRHSSIPDRYHNSGKPIVLAIHGRPESSVRLEQIGEVPVISVLCDKVKDERYKAFVNFWPEYTEIWKNIVPEEKLHYVPAPVDLNEYSPSAIEPFDFGEYKADYNILIADMWRRDVIPFNIIFAAAKFVENHKNAKFHIVGISQEFSKSVNPFLLSLRERGVLGHVAGQMHRIKAYYAACDMFLSPQVIATRSVRESLAFGLKLVAASGSRYTPYTANPADITAYADAIERCYNGEMDSCSIASREFGFKKTGQAIKNVFESIMPKKSKKRKVFIDIGAHTGETVRRFFREVPDADEYEIYSFEPDYETFKKLDVCVGHIENVNLINAMLGTHDGIEEFYVGKDNENEGGTSLKGKLTGRVNYKKPSKVECIDFKRWMKANVNGDYVVLKINAEGGEYDIMEMILDEDLHIDKCFIQFHAHKFEMGAQRQRFQEIESRFCNETKFEKFLASKGNYPFNVK